MSVNDWKYIPWNTPPEDTIIMTKIDDEHGCRNEQKMIFSRNLWWFTDRSMYVYYTPTHWRSL